MPVRDLLNQRTIYNPQCSIGNFHTPHSPTKHIDMS